MGAIRGILLVFVCILIFFSLLVGSFLWTVSSSLQYENVQPGLSSLVDKVIDEQLDVGGKLNIEEKMDDLMPTIEAYCQDNQQYAFVYGGNSIVIPCDILTQGPEAVISHGTNSLIEQYYYKEYNCDFWDCASEGEVPLFLISQKAHDYWKSKFYFSLIAFFVLAVLTFLLVEKNTSFFILVGGLAIVAALPLLKTGSLISRLSNAMGDLGEYVSEMILIFFNQANNVFIKIIIFGAVLLVIGIVLKIFHLGMAITNFFGKFGKSKGKTSDKSKVKAPKGVLSKEGKEKPDTLKGTSKVREKKKEHRSVYTQGGHKNLSRGPKLWNIGAKKSK